MVESELAAERTRRWCERIERWIEKADETRPLAVEGRLSRAVGLTLEADGCRAAVGESCEISRSGGGSIDAEVVGFSGERLLLMPVGDARGLAPRARVLPRGSRAMAGVGTALLGRVVDGLGQPLDGKPAPELDARVPPRGDYINPLSRAPVERALDVGVGCINSLLTVGQGQRLGLFAPSGVGKSVLLGMMTRFTQADVIVVGLIGERGREVQEFISSILEHQGLERSVVVACPADEPPLMRVRGAMLATSIAEYFRDRGQQVLLLMDSLTRFAQAQREIGLAVGEPPATRGYPPSVFARLPELVERAGTGAPGAGAVTAIYTVLTEPDDSNDPVAESARAILDGHIVLSRRLAEQGHFPAIDVEASVSRVMTRVASEAQLTHAQNFRELHASFTQNQDILNVGAYTAGADPVLDRAIELQPAMTAFLRQAIDERRSMADCVDTLGRLMTTANVAAADRPNAG